MACQPMAAYTYVKGIWESMKITEEQESILTLIVQEKSDIEIADEMGYSESTIRRRVKGLKKLFKVKTRAGLTKETILRKLKDDF